MSDGWTLVGIIAALFAGAVAAELYRVPRIEQWGRRQGFVRSDGAGDASRPDRFIEIYGDGRRPVRWGIVMTGSAADASVTVAECELWTGHRQRYWYHLAALVSPEMNLPEFRMESRNRFVEGIGNIISLPLRPLIYLTERAEPSRMEKWLDQWTVKKKDLPAVDFPEDAAFDRAFMVCGDRVAVKEALSPAVRAALLRHGWRGDLFACGDTLVWRRRGLLWPWRMGRCLAEVGLFRETLTRGHRDGRP